MKLIYKSGKEIEFEQFIPKKENLIKVLLKSDGQTSEGIWACISDEDMIDYDNDIRDDDVTRVCILQNDSLMGLPCGSFVPMRLEGEERPTSDVTNLTEDIVMSDVEYAQ